MARKRFEYSGGVWREKRKNSSRIGLKLVLLATLSGVVWSLSRPAPTTPVTLVTAERKDLPLWVKSVGNVQAAHSVVVHPQAGGLITEIVFKEGQQVKKGDVLARIDPSLYRAELAKAVADKEQDMSQLQILRDQLRQFGNSRKNPSAKAAALGQAIHQYEATIQSDIATITRAQALLDYTTVTAPMDGRAGIKRVDAGNIIQPTDAAGLVEITQMNPVSVVFSISEQNLPAVTASLAAKQPLSVTARDIASGNILAQGALQIADNQVNSATGSLILKASFENPQSRLWPGAMVNVQLSLGTLPGAVVVPVAAIIHRGDSQFVYKVDTAKKTITLSPVKITLTQGEEVAVAEGLKQGDQLAVENPSTQLAAANPHLLANIAPAR